MDSERLTWEKMVSLEPELQVLKDEFQKRKFDWANYELLKPKLSRLVGWGRRKMRDEILSTSEAWEIAIKSILDGWEQ